MEQSKGRTRAGLMQMQSLPLKYKIQMTKQRIRDFIYFYGEDKVYISFSGGKDSTVLLDIVRQDYPNVPAVFINTGLEYPSVRTFAQSKENVITLKPDINFRDVLIKYGYPVAGKEIAQTIYELRTFSPKSKTYQYRLKKIEGNYITDNGVKSAYNCEKWRFLLESPFKISSKCCDVMKKKPAHNFNRQTDRQPIIGIMAQESRLRTQKWLKYGCNAFDKKDPESNPMAFWTENDVLRYIAENHLEIAKAYGNVVVKSDIKGQMSICDYLDDYRDLQFETTKAKRTGCIFCMFGITQDKDKFSKLREEEPKLYDYVMRGGEFVDGWWQPTNDGLGYDYVINWLNEHGNLQIGK